MTPCSWSKKPPTPWGGLSDMGYQHKYLVNAVELILIIAFGSHCNHQAGQIVLINSAING